MKTGQVVVKRGAGVVSLQVQTSSLKDRPFPALAVLIDFNEDGTLLDNPNKPELIALRKEILSQM